MRRIRPEEYVQEPPQEVIHNQAFNLGDVDGVNTPDTLISNDLPVDLTIPYDNVPQRQIERTESNSFDVRSQECPICFANICNRVLITCRHMFCQICVERVLNGGNQICPLCRSIIQDVEYIVVFPEN